MVSQDWGNQTNSSVLLKKGKHHRSRDIKAHLACKGSLTLRFTHPGVPAAGGDISLLARITIASAGTRNISSGGQVARTNESSLLQKKCIFKTQFCVLATAIAGLRKLEAFGCGKKGSAPTNCNVCLFLPALSQFRELVTTFMHWTILWDYLNPENELSHEVCILYNPLFARRKDRRD